MTVSTPLDAVRLEIGDRDVSNPLFTDDEIEYFLGNRNDDVHLAAADACESLARRFAREYDFSTDGQSFKRGTRSRMYADLAKQLRERVGGLGEAKQVKVDGYSQEIDNDDTSSTLAEPADPEIPRYGVTWKGDLERQVGEEFFE